MHFIRRALPVCLLALFLFTVTVGAADCLRGTILYRQVFDELSVPANGGIVKGSDGEDGFDISVSENSLLIRNHGDRKSYTLFPFSLPTDDHTVEFVFSFEDVMTSNAYVSFMLTSRGDAPDNISAVTIRAGGECDGFGVLSRELAEKIASGETVTVKIPVSERDAYEITVSSGGITETLVSKTVARVPDGRIGVIVRNASVRVHEISVVNGIGYKAVTGRLMGRSTWSDKEPYGGLSQIVCECDNVSTYFAAPQTYDKTGITVFLSAAVLLAAVLALKKIRV